MNKWNFLTLAVAVISLANCVPATVETSQSNPRATPSNAETASTELRFAPGPFTASARLVASTDVRQYGCSDCGPTMRLLGTPDLNGDGNSEIILAMESFTKDGTASNVPLPIIILQADGQPYRGISTNLRRVHAREAIIADFNGDGRDDVFIVAHGMDRQPFPGEQNVLLLSQPDGTHRDVSATHLPQMDDMSHGAAAGDIDGDGDVDIVVVTNAGGGRAKVSNYFLINDGTGRFSFSSGSNHLPAGTPRRDDHFLTAELVDINNNGINDLVFAGEGHNGSPSLLMLGNGRGGFGQPLRLPVSPFGRRTFTTDIAAVDINSDGLLDLVLLNTGTINGRPFTGINIQILIQQANGSFTDETSQRMWDQRGAAVPGVLIPHSINFVDLNGNGYLDFVVQSLNPLWKQRPGDVPPQIGINDASGRFSPVTPNWPSTSGYSFRQMLPIKINGRWRLAGNSLNGLNEASGFWALGHHLQIYR